MASAAVSRMLGEAKCRIKDCRCNAVPDAREKHGPGFQGLCTCHIDSQKEREAKTGRHSQAIRRIRGEESVAQRLVSDMLSESVTTHLSRTDAAEAIAKKLWGNLVSHVDILRATDAFYEYRVILSDGQTMYLRHNKEGRWWYFNPKEQGWNYATEH